MIKPNPTNCKDCPNLVDGKCCWMHIENIYECRYINKDGFYDF